MNCSHGCSRPGCRACRQKCIERVADWLDECSRHQSLQWSSWEPVKTQLLTAVSEMREAEDCWINEADDAESRPPLLAIASALASLVSMVESMRGSTR